MFHLARVKQRTTLLRVSLPMTEHAFQYNLIYYQLVYVEQINMKQKMKSSTIDFAEDKIQGAHNTADIGYVQSGSDLVLVCKNCQKTKNVKLIFTHFPCPLKRDEQSQAP